ncbi:unnamed protein product, partial [marine sediment metagenome]
MDITLLNEQDKRKIAQHGFEPWSRGSGPPMLDLFTIEQ